MNYIEKYDAYLKKHKAKQNRGAQGTTDSERNKCYKAEHAMLRAMPLVKQFKDIKEAQKFAQKIYKTKTWQKLFAQSRDLDISKVFDTPNVPVELKSRSTGRGTAGWTTGRKVVLDKHVGMDAYTLVHELTHCLGHMHHGRSFRKTLLGMVGVFLGADYKKELKAQFKKQKLAFGDAREPMSFEQYRASVIRMEKMRNG